MDWDVFISHAWEDKEDIARPLAESLRRKGLRVWYDEFTLTLGDSLRRSIDRGLAQSRYGVVILSPSFFAKEWPQRELDGLVAREINSGKVILPVWHNVTWEDVSRFSPTLADKLAVSTTKGLDAVVEEILRALRVDLKAGPTGEEHRPRPHSVPELEMVLIPASEFLMGTEEENVDAIVAEYNTELERIRREVPQRPVFVEEFEIAKYPVTNAEFQRFVEATGYRTQAEKNGYGNIWKGTAWDQVKGSNWHHPQGPHSSLEGKMNYPVVQVSWHDAVAYCEWLSEKTGKPYRLPFEKEWEKVARGTDSREFPWGDEWDESKCKTAQGGPGTTTPVGQYSPHGDSPYGVADMAGNVWEWCTDWFQAYQGNPFPDEYYGEMSKRVLRGGSWKDSRVGARCAYREGDPPDHMDDRIGFRCVRGFSFWQRVLLRLRGLILDRGWLTVLLSSAKRTPAKPRQPVNWEKVGAIAQVIGVLIAVVSSLIAVVGLLIALGQWLVPNAADFLSAWLSETPTVTPTSSPTHTPVISTATPTNTPVPSTVPPTFTPALPTPTQVLPTGTLTPILTTPTLAPPTATPVVPTPTPHLTGKIAYVMSDGIWVMDADGSNRRRVHEGRSKIPFISGGEPVLSPDGSKIAFIRQEGGPEDGLWVMDVNGSGIQQIVSSGRISSTSWAPDSNQIVYTETSGAGYIVKIPDGMPQSVSGQMWSPAWSPDGDWFAGPTEQGLVKRPVWGGPQLVLDSSTDWWATQPAWSPDGTRIVYLKEGDIFAINADGSGRAKLTDHPALERYPYWSPDGSKIVFVTDRDGNNEIYVMNPDGSGQMNLTNSAEDEWAPTWAP